ncbi:MAG: signal recognition particle-docking protein FtsY [Providencia sp.]|uniref:signal recognition particle-docking protein FtsY n=2 Tax=Providencia sp. TaxID=589 RepID=UPI001B72465A|nr:signal recognition particle-docking protein FtsY [Providencia sp.]MBP6080280.1 signal recognition particle-docking protein FtsY [Providencia sp.]
MAKDKKKGLFSWLGFGRKGENETQQQAEQQQKVEIENEVDLQQSAEDAAIAEANAEAERQRQAEQEAIKAAEDEAERQYQAQQAAIDAATEQAEQQRKIALAAIQAAEEQAELERQAVQDARIAQEKAERERLEEEAVRIAEEEAERQRQAELAAIQAAEDKAEQEHQAIEAAAIVAAEQQAAEEKAEQERQAAEAARLAEEEAARLAEEEAERQRLADLAAIEAAAAQAAKEQAEQERQAAEAARLAEEEAERQRLADLAAIEAAAAQAAKEQAEQERQAAEAASLAEEEAERQAQQDAENAPIIEQEKPKKEGFFARLKSGLLKTRQNLGSGFFSLFSGKKIDDDLFEELEEQLLIADVGVETTRKIIDNLTAHASRKELKDADALYSKLREEMSDILAGADKPLVIEDKKPYVILMVGVNGVGKTTTIGKMARQFQSEGKTVMLAAGDTFRAAAVEQLQVWGERNKIPVVAQHTGADPASVIFDGIQSAQAKGADILIADTAGRLQNKAHLMEELKKIVRVMKKLDQDAPHEIMLTLDASTGQNAISQAKLFNEAVGLTGITLTKLDGTAKGGVIFSIADQFGIPIRYIGIGEGIEDLRPFKADDFIEALFAREE